MNAPAKITLVGPSAADQARLSGLVDLVSLLPDVAEDAVEVVKLFDDVIRFRRGLYFDLYPTGRAGELRLSLQFSQALCDLCSALGARDLCGEFVGETGHIEASIGKVGASGVKGSGAGVQCGAGSAQDLEADGAAA